MGCAIRYSGAFSHKTSPELPFSVHNVFFSDFNSCQRMVFCIEINMLLCILKALNIVFAIMQHLNIAQMAIRLNRKVRV